ncbi:MAG: radical SAM family heme chaperone HemW [Fuerstiella sp.]|nr:radical SAM family heme chaperone HemW [Fuerstiella sp.]MCP4855055.1 radical SAM family heme chaperone HemW [Fuerstiella sp.]
MKPSDIDVYASVNNSDAPPRALYVHVPFCLHHCGYCDFTLVADRDDLVPAYLQALTNEFARLDGDFDVDTIFIGGGTPTHLSTAQLEQLAEILFSRFTLSSDGEFSVEANPDGLNDDVMKTLSGIGVNRLSLGVQSFDAEVLKTLERQHTPAVAHDVVRRAIDSFDVVSLDLIFGVPGQTFDSWNATLAAVQQLPITHVSTYGLTFEKGTDFFRRLRHGQMNATPDELERDMYAAAISQFGSAGVPQYEISNFATPGYECRHNMVYWQADEYFAFGPGAARYINGVRSTNARNVSRWINCWLKGEAALQEAEQLSADEKIREAIFLGLRLAAGIDINGFRDRFGCDVVEIAKDSAERHLEDGLLEVSGNHLRLTSDGRFLADTVMADFL